MRPDTLVMGGPRLYSAGPRSDIELLCDGWIRLAVLPMTAPSGLPGIATPAWFRPTREHLNPTSVGTPHPEPREPHR